ncbi:MAG: hypothetical protein GX144_00945 [Clostridiaceae bacterium]|nr:hypothetical protein [Clostridiaceae bacterium]
MDKERNWVLKTYEVPGRKIVWTDGIGQADPQAVIECTEYVLEKAKSFGGGKWAYIPGIDKMDPIFDSETQDLFAEMHRRCEAAGCVAMAFVAGGMATIKVQAKRHQQKSQAGKMIAEHFRTADDALKWLEETFGL